jgi:hypothetical protein
MKKLLIISTLALFSVATFAQKTPQEIQDMMKAMSSGKKTPIKPEYNFAGSMTFENNSTHNGKPFKGLMKYLYPTENEMIYGTEMITEDGNRKKMTNRGIIDYQNKSMIMLMDEQKMAMSLPYDMEKTIESAASDSKYSPLQKTGKTKTIMGFTCEEWLSESADYVSSIWISTKMPINSPDFHKIMQQQMYKNSKILIPNAINGMMMEMQGTNKKTKDIFSMTCVDMIKSAIKISTAGYRTM